MRTKEGASKAVGDVSPKSSECSCRQRDDSRKPWGKAGWFPWQPSASRALFTAQVHVRGAVSQPHAPDSSACAQQELRQKPTRKASVTAVINLED